jgi:hypothetical protein
MRRVSSGRSAFQRAVPLSLHAYWSRHSPWEPSRVLGDRRETPINMTTNVRNGDGDFDTFEITGTKRMSNRWSLLASYGYTKSFDTNNMVFHRPS